MKRLDTIRKRAHVIPLCLFALAGMMLTACAPVNVNTSPASTDAVAVKDAFATEAAALTEGTTVFLTSPAGEDSQVSAGSFYTSALGERCRPINVISAGAMHRFAVCYGKDGWYTVDSVFEAISK